MKKILLVLIAIATTALAMAQQTGYYNGTSGKDGDELKTTLNEIISGHQAYNYRFAKYIFQLSDADPENSDNIIQVYTGFSYANDDYGNSGLKLNREHVWAKSHGTFADWAPMYGDVHNLKPSASTVNQSKSNLDFDNGGAQHDVATGCYYTDSTWEARDEVKGDIARIIFYMSTRYEGNDGELDLEVVDWNNTYPNPQHGKLSTLLEWNLQDPPDEFERNRNDVIQSFQKNRNPFIDNPKFAQLIWGNQVSGPVVINNVSLSPELPPAGFPVQVSAKISGETKAIEKSILKWGYSFNALSTQVLMTGSGDTYSAIIQGQSAGTTIYYRIDATDGPNTSSTVVYSYIIPNTFEGEIVSIYDIQGQQESSPYEGQVVSTTGVVTGNFGDSYFIQDGSGAWNGLFIYELGRNPEIGDSIVVTGEIVEYYDLTEMKNITDFYFISADNQLPEAVEVQTGMILEEHEGVLISVVNANCTDANYSANFGMWEVNDGSGALKIHNSNVFDYDPIENKAYDVTGPAKWDYGEWKIELRNASDVAEGTDEVGPIVNSVEAIINTNIKIIFSEDVDQATAENTANYVIDNDIIVESVTQHAFNKAQVNLTVSSLSPGVLYFITINNIEDLVGNSMEEHIDDFQFVGIEELFEEGNLSVFPNPAKDKLNISFNLKENSSIDISLNDISGKQIIFESHNVYQGENQLSLNVNKVSDGIYILNIATKKGNLRYKVVIN